MDSIIVGSKDCEMTRLVATLQNSKSFSVLCGKLSELRIGLGVEDTDGSFERERTGILIGFVKIHDALTNTLKAWVAGSHTPATLGKLAAVLEKNGMKQIANDLRLEFRVKVSENPPVSNLGADIQSCTETEQNNDASYTDPKEVVCLDFSNLGLNIKYDVLPKVGHEITTALAIAGVNKKVIQQMKGLGIFDGPEIDPVLHGKFNVEQDRILMLLETWQNKEPEQIRMCLVKLCNLEGLPEKSKHFRKYFCEKFPGSVKKWEA